MTPAAGGELNEKILAGPFSESNVELLQLTFSLPQYAGNWIINSLLTRCRKHSGFSFFFFCGLKVHVWRTTCPASCWKGRVLSTLWWDSLISTLLALLHASFVSFFLFTFAYPVIPDASLQCSLSFWESWFWAGLLFGPGLFLDVLLWKNKKQKK